MNRIDRLSAILIQLQTKRLVKAQEIADKFNVSLRTVYRDVRALEEAGVPVVGEAGMGYQLREGYRLPPVMFTEEEASALLTGAKLMQQMSDERLWNQYSSALDKIKATLRYTEKDYIEEMNEHVAVVSPPWLQHKGKSNLFLQQILKAIATHVVIEMSYTSSHKAETVKRKVEPLGIYLQGNYWYLIAWCRLRKDYRNFRTDNIQQLLLTNERIGQKHPPLHHFINKTAEERKLEKVVIEVDREVVKYFGEQKYYNGFVSEESFGDKVRMTFLSGSMQGFAQWFMLFGQYAVIIEPATLHLRVIHIAQAIQKKIELSGTLLT